MLEVLVGILTGIFALFGAILYGKKAAKKEIEKKIRERETEIAKKVLEVKPSGSLGDAVSRLRKNNKLRDDL